MFDLYFNYDAPKEDYVRTHMIAENDPGSVAYMQDVTIAERARMARLIYESDPKEYDVIMHYGVITPGHISFFTVYEEAVQMAREYNGQVFNMFGLTWHLDIGS